MVLAAMVHDDRTGNACLAGLAPGLARALRARLDALAALSRAARHREVRTLVGELTRVPADADAPPRALAILAPDAPRAVARRWAADAPPVRRGFRVTRGLKATLRRLAAPGNPHAREEELAAAARLEPAMRERLWRWAELLGGGDAERALGALALGAEGHLAGDARSWRLRAIGRELAEVWEGGWRA